MGHIQGFDRTQVLLFPEALDDYVTPQNPVRVIDRFVDTLDLAALGFSHAQTAETGRPAYDPADLLKLYIYGYLHRVRSSRLLEREAGCNIEVIWLMKKLVPDHTSIARFRSSNLAALKAVCREFTIFCKSLDLFAGELVAIDGSKFRAVNNRQRNFTTARLAKALEAIDARINSYLEMLSANDTRDAAQQQPAIKTPPLPEMDQIQQALTRLRERQVLYQQAQAEMVKQEQQQVSFTDPDSRSMPVGQGTDVCYNVQTAVDSKHKLIITHEVTNDVTDKNQLAGMAKKAKDVLEVSQMDVVADMGYYGGAEVKECLAAGITPYVAKPDTSANKKKGLFTKDQFTYDQKRDCYLCPQGEELKYRFGARELGRDIRYYYNTAACNQCEIRGQCTNNEHGRRITRWVDEQLLEEMGKRVKQRPEMMKRRKEIVEHPFGTIKRALNAGYFLMKGLQKVGAEMSLTMLSYNFKRVINICGVEKLMAALSG